MFRKILKSFYDKIVMILVKVKFLFKYKTLDFFNDIDVEVNTSCNRRCKYCPNAHFERGLLVNEKLMDVDLYKKIVDELAELNFTGRISPIFYGEPLLRKDLSDLMKYTREKLPKATIKMTTNGDLLNVEKYLELVESGVNKFLVTQHGKKMAPQMKDLLEFLKKNPNKKVKFIYNSYKEDTPLYNRGGTVKVEKVDTTPRCKKPHNPVIVDYAGNVVLCCNDYHSSVKFGNLKDKKLIDIWNSPAYKKVRRDIAKSDYKLEICKKCVGIIK